MALSAEFLVLPYILTMETKRFSHERIAFGILSMETNGYTHNGNGGIVSSRFRCGWRRHDSKDGWHSRTQKGKIESPHDGNHHTLVTQLPQNAGFLKALQLPYTGRTGRRCLNITWNLLRFSESLLLWRKKHTIADELVIQLSALLNIVVHKKVLRLRYHRYLLTLSHQAETSTGLHNSWRDGEDEGFPLNVLRIAISSNTFLEHPTQASPHLSRLGRQAPQVVWKQTPTATR